MVTVLDAFTAKFPKKVFYGVHFPSTIKEYSTGPPSAENAPEVIVVSLDGF